MEPEDADVADLLEGALGAEGDEYWRAVRRLQELGPRTSFELAVQLLDSDRASRRRLGADVLAQLTAAEGRPFVEESLAVLVAASEDEREADVIAAVIAALGQHNDSRAIPGMLRHTAHQSARVRRTVADSLYWVADVTSQQFVEEVLPALGALIADPDPEVRDAATFTLAQHPVDGTGIRALLWQAASDSDERVRGEAICGLARRHDARLVGPLRDQLDAAPSVEGLPYKIDHAAELMASPALRPELVALRARSPKSETLDRAIANSDPDHVQHQGSLVGHVLGALEAVGIDAACSQDLFDPRDVDEIDLVVEAQRAYDLHFLLERAGGSVQQAVRLILEDRDRRE